MAFCSSWIVTPVALALNVIFEGLVPVQQILSVSKVLVELKHILQSLKNNVRFSAAKSSGHGVQLDMVPLLL
jgi:hypothetical protein